MSMITYPGNITRDVDPQGRCLVLVEKEKPKCKYSWMDYRCNRVACYDELTCPNRFAFGDCEKYLKKQEKLYDKQNRRAF